MQTVLGVSGSEEFMGNRPGLLAVLDLKESAVGCFGVVGVAELFIGF